MFCNKIKSNLENWKRFQFFIDPLKNILSKICPGTYLKHYSIFIIFSLILTTAMKIMMKKQQRRNVAVVKKVMGEWMKQLQQLRTCLETKYPQTKKRKERLILFIMKFIFLNSFVKVKCFCSFEIYCNFWYKFKNYINCICKN